MLQPLAGPSKGLCSMAWPRVTRTQSAPCAMSHPQQPATTLNSYHQTVSILRLDWLALLALGSIVSPNSTIPTPVQHKVTSCRQVCRWYGDGMRRLRWDPPDNCGWWPGNFHPVLASDPQFWLVLDTGDWTFKPVAGGAGAGPVATGHSNRVAPCADPGSCPQPPS